MPAHTFGSRIWARTELVQGHFPRQRDAADFNRLGSVGLPMARSQWQQYLR
jgi:hypothetical protein